jgi:hypothetical protein
LKSAVTIETFWVIVSYAVLLGIGALSGFVFYYWFAVIPDRLPERSAGSRARGPASRGRRATAGPTS